jgi:uncharacterized protein YifN (PemK superfamily)
MPLLAFHPDRGAILICHYGPPSAFQPPEMLKARPVVVISPRRRLGQIVSVVPLSSAAPVQAEPWHRQLSVGAYPPARGPMWAKCDMVAAVALGRLDRVKHAGRFQAFQMPAADLTAIIEGVKAALGIR